MQHIFWILTGQLAGRPGPSREPWDLGELSRAGFSAILSLDDREIEPRSIAAAGFSHELVKLPEQLPADDVVTQECISKLPTAYQFIRKNILNGNTVLVHCVGGRDRTGMVLAYYLCATLGLSPEEGIARVRDVRPEALDALAPGWEDMALRVMSKLLGKI